MGRRCMLSRGREEEATRKAGGATTTMSAGLRGTMDCSRQRSLRTQLRFVVALARVFDSYCNASLQGMHAHGDLIH